jgi:tungstate transport system permease protein
VAPIRSTLYRKSRRFDPAIVSPDERREIYADNRCLATNFRGAALHASRQWNSRNVLMFAARVCGKISIRPSGTKKKRTAVTNPWDLIVAMDPKLWEIVGLSLRVSTSATFFAVLIGMPVGALVGVTRFPGRAGVIVVLNALMGLPPVVVGLAVYLLLSRAGPLGALGILFTPMAMIVAQTVLIAPIVAALSRQIIEDAWIDYEEQLRSLGAQGLDAALTLIWDTRFSLVTVALAGLGRAMAEVGAVMIVGGNIDGVTRVMTTTIALETSKGDLPLALGLGVILIVLVLTLNAAASMIRDIAKRRYG